MFEPYTQEAYQQSFDCIRQRGMFDGDMGQGRYEQAVLKLAP